MQNKNWYEYQPQIIAGVIGGIAFAAYRLFRGAAIGAAAGQGVFAGLLVFGVLYAISNAFNAQSQQDTQNLENFIAQQNSAPEMMPLTKEVFEIPGAFYHRTNIAKVMDPNPAWRKTCKVLIKSGIGDKRVYRFRPTTRAAQLVAEPNNPHSDNAVMVQIDGLKVGYIADDEASHVNDILKNKTIVDVSAAITGGEYKLILSEEKMAKYTVGPFIKVTVQYH